MKTQPFPLSEPYKHFTVAANDMLVESAVHFNLGLLLQNPYRGFHATLSAAPVLLHPGGQWEAWRSHTVFPASPGTAELHYKPDLRPLPPTTRACCSDHHLELM